MAARQLGGPDSSQSAGLGGHCVGIQTRGHASGPDVFRAWRRSLTIEMTVTAERPPMSNAIESGNAVAVRGHAGLLQPPREWGYFGSTSGVVRVAGLNARAGGGWQIAYCARTTPEPTRSAVGSPTRS